MEGADTTSLEEVHRFLQLLLFGQVGVDRGVLHQLAQKLLSAFENGQDFFIEVFVLSDDSSKFNLLHFEFCFELFFGHVTRVGQSVLQIGDFFPLLLKVCLCGAGVALPDEQLPLAVEVTENAAVGASHHRDDGLRALLD